jgi:hypothetical protein
MRVRPDPLILGKEFADEGVGTESHSDGNPGAPGSVFIPHLTCQADLPLLPPPNPKRVRLLHSGLTPSAIELQMGSGYHLVA